MFSAWIQQADTVVGSMSWMEEHTVLAAIAWLAVLFSAAWLTLIAVRRFVLPIVEAVVRRSTTTWDEAFFDNGVFHRLTWGIPLLIIYQGIAVVPDLPEWLGELIRNLVAASLVLVLVRGFAALLGAVNEIYNRYPVARERPIKGVLQVISVVAHLVAAIFMIAALLDKSPVVLFGGLGAMSAVTMLVFRDTILSLVAGVQLTANGLIRVGDWIEMPQFNADGDVIDIALNSVRVQNWDKTITSIPAHKFLENSFKNWRGMHESGGRRIKRSIHIDMTSIRFLTEEEIERFGRFALLRDYIARKKEELAEYNAAQETEPGIIANARRLTNIGTLRAYMIEYLRQHPGVHKDMTLLVRHLQPTAEGLPIEVYVFTNDTRWAVYEGIQADLFDHILAMIPEFGLRVFQKPSGHDIAAAIRERRVLEMA